MLLGWVGFAAERLCGCRGGCRGVARQQGGSSVSSSLCTGCCCHDDQCQSVQACSGATLARLPPCLCCWCLSRVCFLGPLLCIHAMITTITLVDCIFTAPAWTQMPCVCAPSSQSNAVALAIAGLWHSMCTQHTACCYLLLGLVTKYLMSCCCCFHHLSGPSCADLSVHDLQLVRCCFALSCLLLFWFGTFKALWLLCRLMPVAQELFGFRASFLLLILGAAGAWCIHGQLHLLCCVLHKAMPITLTRWT